MVTFREGEEGAKGVSKDVGLSPRLTRRSGGFTLIELMVAMTLSVILGLVLMETVVQAQTMIRTLTAKMTLNQEARRVFEMLLQGGTPPGESTRVQGLQGRDASLTGLTLSYVQFRLYMTQTGSGNLSTSEPASVITVDCNDVDDPIDSCAASGESYDVDGYIDRAEYNVTDRYVDISGQRTREFDFTLIDPLHVPESGAESQLTIQEYSEDFWTVFGQYLDG